MDTLKIKQLIHSLSSRNIEACYSSNLEELELKLYEAIPLQATVGIGNSQTLKKICITQKLIARGNTVYDKTLADTKEESRLLSREALLADYYVSSANAVSLEGHIVNIDHTGNRVAALIYGPQKVNIVMGVNKIARTLEEAITRARNRAAIKNAQRVGVTPPCITAGHCLDCRNENRVCNYLVVIEGQVDRNRMKVFIVNEDLGF